MRDKDARKPSRSCNEPGRRRFCWLGNLQGARCRGLCSKTSLLQQGELERQWRLRSGTGLTWQAWPARWVLSGWVTRVGVQPTTNTDHREGRTPSG